MPALDLAVPLSPQPAPGNRDAASPLVLLHGWGIDSRVWCDVVPRLQKQFAVYTLDMPGYGVYADTVVDDFDVAVSVLAAGLEDYFDQPFALCGWSLGGSVAMHLASCLPEKISALITIASNPQFVASMEWPSAVEPGQFQQFVAAAESDPSQLLKRFSLLQTRGSESARRDSRYLQALQGDAGDLNTGVLLQGLQWLQQSSGLDAFKLLPMPVLHQYGTCDALVPVSVCSDVKRLWPSHELQCFSSSSHLPFLSETEAWVRSLERFVTSGQARNGINRDALAASFSDACERYDSIASLQQRVADKLLSLVNIDAACSRESECNMVLLDLGSGTGCQTKALQQRWSQLRENSPGQNAGSDISPLTLALDIAPGMLGYSRAHYPELQHLQADIEMLPLAKDSIGFAHSSLSLQWCGNLGSVFAQLHRGLVPGGKFVFSTLLDGSLAELRSAWEVVDQNPHINRFESETYMRELVAGSGYTIEHWQVVGEVQRFSDARSLLDSVKAIGARNLRNARSAGLTTPLSIRKMLAALETGKDNDGRFTLTYRVLYASITKASE